MESLINIENTDTSSNNNFLGFLLSFFGTYIPLEEKFTLTALKYLPPKYYSPLIALANYTWKYQDLRAKISMKLIAKFMGVSTSKARSLINELIEKNIIIVYQEAILGKNGIPREIGINLDPITWKITCTPQIFDKYFYDQQNSQKSRYLFGCYMPLPVDLIRAACITLKPVELKIVLALASKTWKFSKEGERIGIEKLASMLNMSLKDIRRILERLTKRGVIFQEKKVNGSYMGVEYRYWEWKIPPRSQSKLKKFMREYQPGMYGTTSNDQNNRDTEKIEEQQVLNFPKNDFSNPEIFNQFIQYLGEQIKDNSRLSYFLKQNPDNQLIKMLCLLQSSDELNSTFEGINRLINKNINLEQEPLSKNAQNLSQKKTDRVHSERKKEKTEENDFVIEKNQKEVSETTNQTSEQPETPNIKLTETSESSPEQQKETKEILQAWNRAVKSHPVEYKRGLIVAKFLSNEVQISCIDLLNKFSLEDIEGTFKIMSGKPFLTGHAESNFRANISWATKLDKFENYYNEFCEEKRDRVLFKEQVEREEHERQEAEKARVLAEKRRVEEEALMQRKEAELADKRKSYPQIPEWSDFSKALKSHLEPSDYNYIVSWVLSTTWVGSGKLQFLLPSILEQVYFADHYESLFLDLFEISEIEYAFETSEIEANPDSQPESGSDDSSVQISEWPSALNCLSRRLQPERFEQLKKFVLSSSWSLDVPGELKLLFEAPFERECFIEKYSGYVLEETGASSLKYETKITFEEKGDLFHKDLPPSEIESSSKYCEIGMWSCFLGLLESKFSTQTYVDFQTKVLGSQWFERETILHLVMVNEAAKALFESNYSEVIRYNLAAKRVEYYVEES